MRAVPPLPRAAWLALAASLLAHAAMLGRPPARDDGSRPARPVNVAVMVPPRLPLPLPEATTPAPPAPPVRGTPRDDTPPTPPRPAVVDAPTPPADTPLLRLAGPGSWHYRLRQAGQDGDAQLDWRPEGDGHYSLRLTRRIGERTLPAWESLGHLGQGGLAPERFALQRGGQDRQAINFDADEHTVSFSASPARLELPEGTQDRLSWWLQLAALVQANPAPGGRWRVWVAGLRGELREWVFEAAESAPEDAGTLHLRRLPLGERDPGIELWLDPARSYWPVRLRQGDPETRGFEIQLSGVGG